MRWWLLPLLLAPAVETAMAPPALASPAGEPRLQLDPGRRLVLTGLPPILADDGVKELLTSGLTTSVYFRPGGKLAGGARVDVRYDPWDEVFHLAVTGFGEREQRRQAASFAELLTWWQELWLMLADSDRLEKPWPERLKVTADVVPFSQSEEGDARRWFSDTIHDRARSGTEDVGRSGEKRTDALTQTFNLLLATSIRRRAVVSYTWTLTLPEPRSAGSARPTEDPP